MMHGRRTVAAGGSGEARMSEGRRVAARRRRDSAGSDEDRTPFVMRRWPRRAFDYVRNRTTSSPSRFAVLVFATLILLFTALFSLPAAATDGKRTALADALFTAVSTICVTGLSTLDVATHFSAFGKTLIFIGVNIGGMGVLTLASILGLVISKRLGLRAKLIAASDTNPLRSHGGPVNEGQTVRLGEVGQLLRTVALSTLVIEAAVAVLLYPSLVFAGIGPVEALWEAPFYAAMAFTNTGFTPNVGGLEPFADDYVLLTVLMAGVFLGSIGFPVIFALRRHLFHVRRWSLHAKLTLITTVLLFFAGAAAFLILEYDNPKTFGAMSAGDTTFQALFLSAMTRSGGFSVVDIGELHGSSLVVGSMLMFVGGGSASTAGGIKVTTLAVLALAVLAEAKGRQSVESFGRRIPSDVQRVALSVVAWGSTICALSTITVAQISQAPVSDVLFDVISAFGTVGLSTGLTAELSDPAVYVMAVTIFMGRIGTVTLAAAVAATSRSQLYSLPVERPIVG
jgi:Trk-type K+ transport system membrane component